MSDFSTTQKDRIIQFRTYLQMTQRAFEISIGVSISAIAHSKGNLSADIINKACATYPILNRMWLLTGEGTMLNSPAPEVHNFAPNYGVAKNVGNQITTLDSDEVISLRKRVHELEKELHDREKLIAKLEGKIELYKEMLAK